MDLDIEGAKPLEFCTNIMSSSIKELIKEAALYPRDHFGESILCSMDLLKQKRNIIYHGADSLNLMQFFYTPIKVKAIKGSI
jgi:hypothetical protein